MGCYINPPSEPKETWLMSNGKAVHTNPISTNFPPYESLVETGMVPVVLMDNGMFTAAGVAYDGPEYIAFTEPSDPRPRLVFLVGRDDLLAVCPEAERYLDG